MTQELIRKTIQTFTINNRKYIGSKYRLLNFIEQIVLSKVKTISKFIDGFSGTGVVAHHFRKYSNQVIANDLLYSNYVINKAFLCSTRKNTNLDRIYDIIYKLNRLRSKKGYVYLNFGGSYFTIENACIIDAIREKIDRIFNKEICTLQEKYILLTSLIFAVDKVANTVGQYDAFLKHIGKSAYDDMGKHRIDSNVYKKIKLNIPEIIFDGKNKVYNEDLNQLILKIKGTVLYLDPPYNNRQYIDNYHVLENIAKWNKPVLYGKTKKFKRDNLKSKYSRKQDAFHAFSDLIELSQSKHIFLSYNNEGIIPDDLIIKILKSKGQVEIFEEDYNIFGNGAGKSRKRKIKERIFYCKVHG